MINLSELPDQKKEDYDIYLFPFSMPFGGTLEIRCFGEDDYRIFWNGKYFHLIFSEEATAYSAASGIQWAAYKWIK